LSEVDVWQREMRRKTASSVKDPRPQAEIPWLVSSGQGENDIRTEYQVGGRSLGLAQLTRKDHFLAKKERKKAQGPKKKIEQRGRRRYLVVEKRAMGDDKPRNQGTRL